MCKVLYKFYCDDKKGKFASLKRHEQSAADNYNYNGQLFLVYKVIFWNKIC